MDEENNTLTGMTVDIVAAYVARNSVPAAELGSLIGSVHKALHGLTAVSEPKAPDVSPPAVSIKKSVSQDFITCLEDGRKFKSLKRHLRTKYGMTPEDYRAKWGLPKDYPMVAPAYAQARSAMAKTMGLGVGGRVAAKAKPASTPAARKKAKT